MDAGHFVSRDRYATRWSEVNVNVQCPHCNRFRAGEQYRHGVAIDKKYGPGTAQMLEQLGSARGTKISPEWIEERIEYYRKKVKEIMK